MRRLLSGLVAGLALMGLSSAAQAEAFDFYVLALSWSPSYCASQGTNAAARVSTRPSREKRM